MPSLLFFDRSLTVISIFFSPASASSGILTFIFMIWPFPLNAIPPDSAFASIVPVLASELPEPPLPVPLLKVKFSAVFNNFLNHLTRRYLKNFYVACIVFKCHVETVCFIVALDNDFGFDFFTGTARYFTEKNTYACVGVFIGNNRRDFKVYRVASAHFKSIKIN